MMNGSDQTSDNSTDAAKMQIRLSKQQKMLLQRLMINNPNLQDGTFTQQFTHNSARKLWTKIAIQLNSIPGARKTWSQWRRTWQDVKKNSGKSQSFAAANDREVLDHELSTPELIVYDDTYKSHDDDDVDDEDEEIHHVKRGRAKNISKTQKKLMHSLVNSNEKLQNDNVDGPSLSCVAKRQEWKKIALKLNSVTGPQKTWSQWKKSWRDVQKYALPGDAAVNIAGSENEDVDISKGADIAKTVETSDYIPSRKIPSANQFNCMIKEMVKQRGDVWMSLSNRLNSLGPCVKNFREWKNVWNDYKCKLQKLVDRKGTKNLNKLQRLAYEHIQGERSKNVRKDAVDPTLTENQLQHLQRTADQECGIIGRLVAVKLRSMQKEQKLIAEKLISEILFQGQMEMFHFSDQVVNIPGYMQ